MSNCCFLKESEYVHIKNNKLFCSEKCLKLYLGPKFNEDSDESFEEEIDDIKLVLSEKYNFDIIWNFSLYFKLEIFLYQNSNDQFLFKTNIIGPNKNLIENIIFKEKEQNFDLVFTKNTKEINDNLDKKFIKNLFNNNFYYGGIFWNLINVNDITVLQSILKGISNDFNKSKILSLQKGIELTKMGHYFKLDDKFLYFHKYIDFILRKSFIDIFNMDLMPDENENFSLIPNPFSGTNESISDQCNKYFRIVIPNLKTEKKKWKFLINEYLERDKLQIEGRKNVLETMMIEPPQSYIKNNNYFHFLAIDSQGRIMGYVICKIFPLEDIRGTHSFMEKIRNLIPQDNDTSVISDNNYEYFINHLLSHKTLFNKDDVSQKKIWYYDDENLKTNIFSIESLSVDKSVRGIKFRLAHFLIYNAMIFIQNSYKDLHVGLVTTYAAAEATGHIVSKYFSFTEPKKKNKSNIEFIDLSKNLIKKTNEIQFIYDEIKDANEDELDDYNSGENNLIEEEENIKYPNYYNKGKEMKILKIEYKKLELEYENFQLNFKFLKTFFDYYHIGYTHILWIENENFIENMNEITKKLKKCIDERKGKRKNEGDEERERKKMKFKGLSLKNMNKLFQ